MSLTWIVVIGFAAVGVILWGMAETIGDLVDRVETLETELEDKVGKTGTLHYEDSDD
jgi:hypothetical protein